MGGCIERDDGARAGVRLAALLRRHRRCTDQVAFTTTTAQLRTVETFFEKIVNENADALSYGDAGTPARLVSRVEIFRGANEVRRVMWRAHELSGNGGSRPVMDFIGDTRGTATGGSATTLEATGAFDASFVGGYVAIVAGTAAGEIRHIAAVASNDTVQVDAAAPWTEAPGSGSEFVAVRPGTQIIAVASESPVWLEESTTVLGFSLYQRATDILDIKQGTRVMPSTHNFVAADNQPFNGPLPVNYRYTYPHEQGREFIVAITGGSGYKQTRRVASNSASSLTIDYPWGVIPSAGDTFEVYAIVGMPEAINPTEGYMANWNNKAATADDGDDFGRLWRHLFILERLGAETAWDRDKERTLNEDVAGLDSKGDLGRFLLPRLRQAVNAVGNGGNAAVDTVLARLEAQEAAPDYGRNFNDPVRDTMNAGEVAFLNQLLNTLAQDIYGDEFDGAVPVPTGSRALSMVQHAIDSAAGDLPNGYAQAFDGDYFNGVDWRVAVRDSFAALASQGVPADSPRPQSTYRHPLAALLPQLVFEPTPFGNRGTYEQIIDVSPLIKGEFIFPLGQSGLIQGSLTSVTAIDRNFTSLQPIWRDWRFVPMLPLARDIGANGTADSDGDGVPDAYERWYFGDLSHGADDDSDHDGLTLSEEYTQGVDPTSGDTDGDGIRDGFDTNVRDRLGDSKCSGDCNADLAVTIDELLHGVAIALGTQTLDGCPVADFNGDGQVDIAELMRAVNAALIGCRA